MNEVPLVFAEIEFMASSLKTLYHAASKTVFISDCHFGKATHFRNNHIPIPPGAALPDYKNLISVIHHYQPTTCIFLGDLFHSTYNAEWELVTELFRHFNKTNFILVIGNHDILNIQRYKDAGIAVSSSILFENKILLSHEPVKDTNKPNLYGHIHPGYIIHGKARQIASLPCFYMHKNQLIMPAFGTLTGHVNMKRLMPGGKALCLAGEELMWIE